MIAEFNEYSTQYDIVLMLKFLNYSNQEVFFIPNFNTHFYKNVSLICCDTYGNFFTKIRNSPEGMRDKIRPTIPLLMHTYKILSDMCRSRVKLLGENSLLNNSQFLIKKLYKIDFIKNEPTPKIRISK